MPSAATGIQMLVLETLHSNPWDTTTSVPTETVPFKVAEFVVIAVAALVRTVGGVIERVVKV